MGVFVLNAKELFRDSQRFS